MWSSSGEIPRASRLWPALPYAVFAVFFALTFKRWVLPFQDSGREIAVPLRLLSGDLLYRDVEYLYGPLPVYLDAACLRLFGRHLDVLIALRTVIGVLGVEALRRLARRIVPDVATAAAITAFIVATCGFDTGGAYPFPYSAAALEGAVGTWWALELALCSGGWGGTLAAGLIAGLASSTKLEVAAAAAGAVGIVLAIRRPRREAAAAVALAAVLAAVAFVGPIALFGLDVIRQNGFLLFPPTFQRLYEFSVLFGGMTAVEFWSGGWVKVLLPSAVYAALIFIGLSISFRRRLAVSLATGLAFAAGVAAIWSDRNAELHALLPLAAVLGAFDLVRAAGRWWRGEAVDPARCGLAVAMAPALARQPFFLRNMIYGAFAAPLALLVSLAGIARGIAARGPFVALLLGLTIAQGVHRWQDVGGQPAVWTELPGASLYLPAEESAFLLELAAVLPRVAGAGGWAAVFPETGFVNFVTGLKNPFIDEQFLPGQQDAAAEAAMIRRLDERKPVLVISNRSSAEYSWADGGRDALPRFFAEVSRGYVGVRKLGGLPMAGHRQHHASEGLLLVPADRVRGEPAP